MTQAANKHLVEYEQKGYTIFRNVLDADLIKESVEHIDWLLKRNPDLRPEQLDNYLMTHDAFWVRLVSDERLLKIAEIFLGQNLALFASHYISKRPGDGQKVLWHQDGSYWPLEPMEVATLWLAVDDSDQENGCMRVIPGTQNQRLLSLEDMEKIPDGNVLGSGIAPDQVAEDEAVDIVLKAGDISMHDPKVIHGSNANNSDRWRRALTIRYMPASTRIITDTQWPSAFMLSGAAQSGVNSYLPWPKYAGGDQMSFAGHQAWNEKCDQMNARYAAEINQNL